MQIRLNGKDRDVGEGITVAQLLEELEIRPERVAVLVNQGIVKKPSYASTMIQEGDAVEVLTVMAGGVGEVVLMGLGLSFLATLDPSWRAARIEPAEALRYE